MLKLSEKSDLDRRKTCANYSLPLCHMDYKSDIVIFKGKFAIVIMLRRLALFQKRSLCEEVNLKQ